MPEPRVRATLLEKNPGEGLQMQPAAKLFPKPPSRRQKEQQYLIFFWVPSGKPLLGEVWFLCWPTVATHTL